MPRLSSLILWSVLMTALAVCAPAQAAILYVDKDNSCPGSGTTGAPYCSIITAFNVVNPGDTIRIRNSATPYDQNATLVRSGTAANRIIIEPDVGHTPIIRYSGNGEQVGAFELQRVSYVTVQNLTFDGTGVETSTAAIMVRASVSLTDGTDMFGIQILGNTFKNWGGDGTAAYGRGAVTLTGGFCTPDLCPATVNGAIVRNNTFDGNRQTAMQVVHAQNSLIESNLFVNTKCGLGVDTSVNTIGIWMMGDGTNGPSNDDRNIIRNNVFRDWERKENCAVPHQGTGFDTIGAIWCDAGSWNGTIEGNLIKNIQAGDPTQGTYTSVAALVEFACYSWTLKNNIVHDIGLIGLVQRHYNPSPASEWTMPPTTYLNNTFYHVPKPIGIVTGQAVVKNNILYGQGPYTLINTSYNFLGVFDIDYNLYYNPGDPGYIGTWGDNVGGAPGDLAAWQSQCQCDAHSAVGDPLFVSTTPGAEDLRLQPTSPARGAGVGGVDLGAYRTLRPPTNLRIVP